METRGQKRRSSQADLDAAVEAVLAGASYKRAEALTGFLPQRCRVTSCDGGSCDGAFRCAPTSGSSTGYPPSGQVLATSVGP